MLGGVLLRSRGCLFGGGGSIFWGGFGRFLIWLSRDCLGVLLEVALLRVAFAILVNTQVQC